MKGFEALFLVVIICLLIIGIAGAIYIVVSDYYGYKEANQELKDRIDKKNGELSELKLKYDTDKNLYKKGNSFYYNTNYYPLKKVLNLNELKLLKEQGYE